MTVFPLLYLLWSHLIKKISKFPYLWRCMRCDSESEWIFQGTRSSKCTISCNIVHIPNPCHFPSSFWMKKKKKRRKILSKNSWWWIFEWKLCMKKLMITHLAYRKVKIRRGNLNIVIRIDPLAAEPRLYFRSFPMAVMTGESVGLRKYQNATAPAKANCWHAKSEKMYIKFVIIACFTHEFIVPFFFSFL